MKKSMLAVLGAAAAKPLIAEAIKVANTTAELEKIAVDFGYDREIAVRAWKLAGDAAVQRPDVGIDWIVERARAVFLALI